MANLSNKDLSVICTSTGNPDYVKSVKVPASVPASDLSSTIGRQGDWAYIDPSLYVKVSSTVWTQVNVGTV